MVNLDVVGDSLEQAAWLDGKDPMAEPPSEALLSIAVGPHVHVHVDRGYQITVSVHGGSAVIDGDMMTDAVTTAQQWAASHRPPVKGKT